jgi:hypothetical protein
VATLTAAGAAAALGYGLTAPKEYRATALMLVSPVSASDSSLAGLDLFRDAAGRRTAAESAAALVETPQVADAVRAQLGLRRSRESLLAAISTDVVDGSDVVEVRAADASAASAAQLANAFVDALIAQRASAFQSRLTSAIARDSHLLRSTRPGPQATELARRLAVLRGLQGEADPTLRRASTATPPASAASRPLWQLVLLGAAAGLAVAALLVLALTLAHRRAAPAYDLPVAEPGSDVGAAEALVERLEQRLAARESALAARERDLQARIDELRRLRGPRREGVFDLGVLERLVAERGGAHPDRLEEWESCLVLLRDHAAADGSLPHSFDPLVEETFRPLLAAPP